MDQEKLGTPPHFHSPLHEGWEGDLAGKRGGEENSGAGNQQGEGHKKRKTPRSAGKTGKKEEISLLGGRRVALRESPPRTGKGEPLCITLSKKIALWQEKARHGVMVREERQKKNRHARVGRRQGRRSKRFVADYLRMQEREKVLRSAKGVRKAKTISPREKHESWPGRHHLSSQKKKFLFSVGR